MAKVLLADDSVTIHKVVEIILTAKGFALKAVADGEKALDLVRTFKPDVVLADIEMPGLTGYELAEKIRKNPATKDIPVILLAGAFETIDNARAQKCGAASTLIKPFESEDLVGKIKAVLSPAAAKAAPARKAEPAGEVLEVEGLEAIGPDVEEEMAEAGEEAGEELEMEGFEVLGEEGMEEELTAVEEAPPVEEAVEAVSEAEAEFTAIEAPEEEAVEVVSEAEAEFTALEAPFEEEAVTEGLAEPEPVGLEAIAEELYAAPVAPAVGMPDTAALAEAFRRAAEAKIAEAVGALDMKAIIMEAIAPTLGDAVEKVIWEIAPDLTEKLARQTLEESLKNLRKEIETVIWETVPEIAENIISKEIKKIKEET